MLCVCVVLVLISTKEVNGVATLWVVHQYNSGRKYGAETKYQQMMMTICELQWLKVVNIYCDGQSTLHITQNLIFYELTKFQLKTLNDPEFMAKQLQDLYYRVLGSDKLHCSQSAVAGHVLRIAEVEMSC